MATKTLTVLVSDISGEEIADGGKTVEFSYKGTSYTIDLSDSEAAKFDRAIEPYTKAATKTSGRSGSRKASGSGRTPEELAHVREWAKGKGIEVSERGRIKKEILDQFDAEQG